MMLMGSAFACRVVACSHFTLFIPGCAKCKAGLRGAALAAAVEAAGAHLEGN